MKRLRLTPEAERDLDEAHLWYQTQSSDRAAAFLAAVDACLATIQRHPHGFTLVDQNTRRALVRRFPYAIFYEIEPRQIIVYGIFHGARDPRIWRRRRDG